MNSDDNSDEEGKYDQYIQIMMIYEGREGEENSYIKKMMMERKVELSV